MKLAEQVNRRRYLENIAAQRKKDEAAAARAQQLQQQQQKEKHNPAIVGIASRNGKADGSSDADTSADSSAGGSEVEICAICQQPLNAQDELAVLPCAHEFCAECMLHMLDKKRDRKSTRLNSSHT